ncbi:hypothetical protein P3T37_006924 [Kitasatospora sp. MAA4]|uniref:hypothetical protein n=1 Tax=Kitasatospora sp. MAA4 TaxID=3035093 RepID=UPI00247719A4|nr:hypothetical protein [Kitasatospora sp. MAA4]MDH6137491.1 hypothetical protein [Kitasatospora sp. MAA4]
MSSFHTHRARVHDADLPPYRRLSALRTCLEVFAPYGLRATYHHLVLSAQIPEDLARDPESLVRAVEELHAARQVWLSAQADYVQRRRAEKHAGQRQPARHEALPTWSWGWGRPGYLCPDPRRHPARPLSEVVRHSIGRAAHPDEGGCPLCTGSRAVLWDDGYATYQLCRRCGIALHVQRSTAGMVQRIAAHRQWQSIWHRTLERVPDRAF